MMTDEEFIAELRAWTNSPFDDDAHEAADRIEQLIRDRDFWIGTAKTAIWTDSEELAFLYDQNKKLEDALRWYASDEAWVLKGVEGPDGDYGKRARATLKELEDNNDH